MIKIEVSGKMSIEAALKKYRAKYTKIGIAKELFERKEFKKPSVEKRDEISRAKYRETLNRKSNED
jgi:small subunit ribosomal protein S21